VEDTLRQDNLEFINDVMNSWAVQLFIAALLVGLVIVAFTRASRIFEDDRTRRAFRIVVAALGVLVVAQAVATAVLGRVPLVPIVVIEFVWLAAMWFYYVVRLMTGQRSGSGDPETQRRGAALDGTISRMEDERRDHGTGSTAGGSAAPR
jgi:uncharacterized membrane protein